MSKLGKSVLVTVILGLTMMASSSVWAKAESAKIKDIRKLMALTGAADLGMQVMDQMMVAFERNMPKVPKAFWAEFRKEIDVQVLVDLVVPVYDKHLNHEDIKALLVFYESSAGKKLIRVLPQITKESMASGEAWGRQIAERALKKLKAKGYR